ncbi:hypothetical protein PanWU01x14_057860 [Parasponia andersonii]|uniref:Uncharacterized protein n=1 Tax=Parasponia andersonii TaxID=3476 RepID=A0A2P5DJX9_PARAD|nr:hypothetical protein PanWU01x14_057860 [Parasponia andersonii]
MGYGRARTVKEPECNTWTIKKMNGLDHPNKRCDLIGSMNMSSKADWSTSRRMTCSHRMLGPVRYW